MYKDDRPVAYRTSDMTVVCLSCLDHCRLPDYRQQLLEPICQAEAEQMCDEGECVCAECERCVMDVASRYP